ncbi:DUF805 domain-containing protein [Vallitalea okinawensis]|uniref:DUF805 domain-containing protein n=1 Tax=Vallitalea okinawensis TaxID=2078660 RepID=UPI0013002096|nr:DUF805 domain-containing protein [Vallitalea okinawensis]
MITLLTKGRITRFEYIKFMIMFGIVSLANKSAYLYLVDHEAFIYIVMLHIFGSIWAIGLFSVVIRRLHDLDQSGFLMLCLALPHFNYLFLFLLCVIKGNSASNKYDYYPILY